MAAGRKTCEDYFVRVDIPFRGVLPCIVNGFGGIAPGAGEIHGRKAVSDYGRVEAQGIHADGDGFCFAHGKVIVAPARADNHDGAFSVRFEALIVVKKIGGKVRFVAVIRKAAFVVHVQEVFFNLHGFILLFILSLCYTVCMDELQTIRDFLFSHQDTAYRDFQAPLIPSVRKESVIGVRTPVLRAYAKELVKDEKMAAFLEQLPHVYFEENQLHGFVISLTKDFDRCLSQVEAFLPFVDNWATCDQLSPKVFAKHTQSLLPEIDQWLASGRVYTVRFGIACLMRYFLDEHFDRTYLEKVCSVLLDDYYVRMMQAWYFATALAKQWDATVPFIKGHRLEPWTEKKAVQKARESFRVSDEHKAELLMMKG